MCLLHIKRVTLQQLQHTRLNLKHSEGLTLNACWRMLLTLHSQILAKDA